MLAATVWGRGGNRDHRSWRSARGYCDGRPRKGLMLVTAALDTPVTYFALSATTNEVWLTQRILGTASLEFGVDNTLRPQPTIH